MTREEIIKKGEEQLQYTLDQAAKGSINWARSGLNQLDMLLYILDQEYERYDYWFNEFLKYA